MFAMLSQLFRTITLLFAAGEKVAVSLNNLATVGEEMSQSYAEVSRLQRKADVKARLKELGLNEGDESIKLISN